MDWKRATRRFVGARTRLKRAWVPALVVAILVLDAATLASGSVLGSILWPFGDPWPSELIWRVGAYRIDGEATISGGRGGALIAVAEFRTDTRHRPLWASTSFSPGRINISAIDGARLSPRDVESIARDMRVLLARRFGPTVSSIPAVSLASPFDRRGLLGIVHNGAAMALVVIGLYATPTMMRTLARYKRAIDDLLRPKSADEIRREKLAKGRCPTCRYDVRGLVENRCPECGRGWPVREHVLIPPTEGPGPAWVAALPDAHE